MRHLNRLWLIGLGLCLVFIGRSAAQDTSRRVALVIGNGAYDTAPLRNPVHDAMDMAAVLHQVGFTVTLRTDVTQPQMEAAVETLSQALRSGGVGLFYFAGHGVQMGGQNYLLPVKAGFTSATDVKYKAVAAGWVLGKLAEAGNNLNLLILDACRNNPYTRQWRSAQAGLAPMQAEAGQGILMAYATAPEQVAIDGTGRNSPYTKHLLQQLRTPGLSVEEVLKRVRAAVIQDTGGKQTPWESSSLIGEFRFVAEPVDRRVMLPPQADDSAPAPSARPTSPSGPVRPDPEVAMWALVESSTSPDDVRKFLQAYPKGRFAPVARLKLQQLERQQRPPDAAGKPPVPQPGPLPAPTDGPSRPSEALVGAEEQYRLGEKYFYGQSVAKDEQEAIKWYRKAADQGHAKAQNKLGLMYRNGHGVAKDDGEAVRWYRKAAEQGDANGQTSLGWMYLEGRGVAKDEAQAVQWTRKAIAQGNAQAQNNLGVMYRDGIGVAKDETQAMHWYRKAAEQGNIQGQYNLGRMYAEGRGVAKDETQAVHWYRKAAEQGYANAQASLGWMYLEGRGVAKDETQAVHWIHKAIAQGNAQAQNNLGVMYQSGKGVAKDEVQAVHWYRKAAEQGNTLAQDNLGWMYAEGRGVAKDEVQAVHWYRKAAEQGNALAQNHLGIMYRNGRGVAKDEVQAVHWYRQAAEQGNAHGQSNLGWMYAEGRGVAKDETQAVHWYRKAADQGHQQAQEKLRLFSSMK